MTGRDDINWQDPAHEAAAEWVVRLHASVSTAQAEADWLAFEAWLNAASGNRSAYDAAEALWNDIGRQSRALERALAPNSATILSFPARRGSSGPIWWAATAAAAASLLLFVGPFSPFNAASPTVYEAGRGQHRTVNLADGSRMELNGGSQASVMIDGRRRVVDLAEGSEAAFSVVHDASRPFVVEVGDRTIRDVGTEFNVMRSGGDLTVTVRSGQVEVAPGVGAVGQTVALTPGRQLTHREGAAAQAVADVSADDAFSWRTGRLIYRNRTLAAVAADLSRYYATPVKTVGKAGDLPFSGVIEIGAEPAMIDRLTALEPVSANSQDGVIILRERADPR